MPPTAGTATGRGFSFLVTRNCAGLIREGPTIPRLLILAILADNIKPGDLDESLAEMSHCFSTAHCCHSRVSHEEGAAEDTTWSEC